MERGRGTFIRIKGTGGSVAPSRFERLEQSTDARKLNLLRYREAGQVRRRRPTIEEVIQKSREKRVLESGFGGESDSPAAKAIVFLAVTGSAVGLISACGGGGSAENPTQTDIEPSPSNTLIVTSTPGATPEVTPIPATESPKLYGPAPTLEELRNSIVAAYGGEIAESLDRDIGICLEGLKGNPRYDFDLASNSTDAQDLLNFCASVASHLTSEATGSATAINEALDKLRDAEFAGAERLLQRENSPLSPGYLLPGAVQRRIDLYYTHK